MGQTLTHGIYLPDEGERNCYSGLAANWQILDSSVGTIAEHTTQIAGKAPAVHTHTKADITDFPAYGNAAGTICEGNDSRLSDARTPVAHTHVTADVTDILNTTHEWTKEQVCDEGFTAKSTTIERCVTPDTIKHINFTFKDKNDKGIGAVRRYFRDSGDQQLQVFGNTRIKDGQYDETGSDVFFGFSEVLKPDGTKYFSFDGYMGSNLVPLSANQSIGSASYQWNNLYAKNYYYNGTAWGLDKENVWTGNNRFSKNSALSDITSYTDTSISFTGNSNTIFFNTRGSSNYASFGTFLFAGYMSGSAPDRYGQLKLLRSTDLKGGTNDGYVPDTSFNLWRVAPHYLLMDIMEAVRVQNSGTSNYIAPITTDATDLGTSTNKWKSVYAQTYYYNGVAWGLDKGNVWTGNNTFTNSFTLKNTSWSGKVPPSGVKTVEIPLSNSDTMQSRVMSRVSANSTETWITTVRNIDANTSYESTLIHVVDNNGNRKLQPLYGDVSLGAPDSGSRFKSFNGVNPGALSLPDTLGTSGTENVNYFNVIGYLNNTGTLATIPATATYDGWLYINAKDGADSYIIVDDYPSGFGTSVFGNNGLGSSSVGLLCLICPIRKGHAYNVRIKTDGIVSARIYPAQGNV